MTPSYLIDTDWIIHYLNGQRDIVNRLVELRKEGLAISAGPPHEESLLRTKSRVLTSHPHIFLSLFMDCFSVFASCNKLRATCRMIAIA